MPAHYIVRPLGSEDRDGLAAAFHRLSPQTRFRRFLGPKNELGPRELTYLVDIDHVAREAVVAVEPLSGRLIGVARYGIHADDPSAADVAVVVADAWQGCGVGTVLMRRLVERARDNDIARLTAETLWDNEAARALCARLGFRTRQTRRGIAELELWLDASPAGSVAAPRWISVS